MTSGTQEQAPVDVATGELREEHTQQLEHSPGPSISLGLAPLEVEAAWRFANMLARSSMVPKQFQGKPDDVIVAMQHGVEVGLPPMASLQSICVINGRPGLWGDGLLGVVVSFRGYAKHDEYYLVKGERCSSASPKDLEHDDTRAVSRFWRRGNPEPFVGEFSVGDAKKAGLWTKDGPWRSYPARMMKMRARSFAARDAFPDALRGLKAAEELLDTPEDIVVETVRTERVADPVRRSEKALPLAPAPAAETAAAHDAAVLTNELPLEGATQPSAGTSPATPRSAGRSSTPAATTRTPDSRSQAGHGTSMTTDNMVVTDTAYIAPPGQDPFYEIKATVQKQGRAPIGMIFNTPEEALYKLAASCEGTGQQLHITWHGSTRQDGSPCKVLDAIVSAN